MKSKKFKQASELLGYPEKQTPRQLGILVHHIWHHLHLHHPEIMVTEQSLDSQLKWIYEQVTGNEACFSWSENPKYVTDHMIKLRR
jgi:hypothetical protein